MRLLPPRPCRQGCCWPSPLPSLTARTFFNALAPRGSTARAAPHPDPAAAGSAYAVARCFGELATGARTLGLTDRTLNELTTPGVPPPTAGAPRLHTDIRYSAGFLKPCPACPFGSSDRAFGADGAGGAFGFADPDLGLGYAYAPNRMGFHLFDDPREQSLRTAVYRCLGVQPRTPCPNR